MIEDSINQLFILIDSYKELESIAVISNKQIKVEYQESNTDKLITKCFDDPIEMVVWFDENLTENL
ncbi:hypothetical protein [Tenacibaculum maritimum]|uniref:hypothetical protein n=1 Tax=Tenacibaculum maritimum TaxID=107401 RepID=UPI0012E5BB7C|nr:hypothetical protein [Tenacibaculum maritimum]CAA0230076.1 hypothetical protein TMP139_50004 [Tenacibaculum maritimum]CAA0250183.1 hypothetical protein TMP445_760092 [Tenacibaculum maritimum]